MKQASLPAATATRTTPHDRSTATASSNDETQA
jgi:hypothetical protein